MNTTKKNRQLSIISIDTTQFTGSMIPLNLGDKFNDAIDTPSPKRKLTVTNSPPPKRQQVGDRQPTNPFLTPSRPPAKGESSFSPLPDNPPGTPPGTPVAIRN